MGLLGSIMKEALLYILIVNWPGLCQSYNKRSEFQRWRACAENFLSASPDIYI